MFSKHDIVVCLMKIHKSHLSFVLAVFIVVLGYGFFVGQAYAELKPGTPDVTVVTLDNPIGTTNIPFILGKALKPILGIMGSAALLMFVVGGFLWLTAAGNAERVKKGTQAMIWATVGVFIIFSSYAILDLVFEGLGVDDSKSPSPIITTADEIKTGAKSLEETYKCICKVGGIQADIKDEAACKKAEADAKDPKKLSNCAWQKLENTIETIGPKGSSLPSCLSVAPFKSAGFTCTESTFCDKDAGKAAVNTLANAKPAIVMPLKAEFKEYYISNTCPGSTRCCIPQKSVCGDTYGSQGLSCATSKSKCQSKGGDLGPDIVQEAWDAKKAPGAKLKPNENSGYYITGVCPGSAVCCVKK